MKSRLFFLFFALLATQTLFSQIMTPADDAAMRNTVGQLTEKYHLNADQAKQVYQIQQRKNRNLAEIASCSKAISRSIRPRSEVFRRVRSRISAGYSTRRSR